MLKISKKHTYIETEMSKWYTQPHKKSMKCKWEQQWDNISHSAGWQNSGSMGTPSISEDIEQWGLWYTADGNGN